MKGRASQKRLPIRLPVLRFDERGDDPGHDGVGSSLAAMRRSRPVRQQALILAGKSASG